MANLVRDKGNQTKPPTQSSLRWAAVFFSIALSLPSTAFADENGISFWLPGIYGSLAAAPQQPGFTFTAINYFDSVSANGSVAASREITIGKLSPNVNVNLNVAVSAKVDVVLPYLNYVFASRVFGGQLNLLDSPIARCLLHQRRNAMRKWNRKCGNYGQVGNFDGSNDDSNDNNSTDYSFNSTRHLKSLIQGHAQWIQRYLDQGWDGYLFTINFNELPGKRDAKIIQMHQEVTRLYGRLTTRMVRKPRSPKWVPLTPMGIFIPDKPVPKSRKDQKSTIADVSINEGLHMHGIVLGNRWGRICVPLDQYFEENAGKYVKGKIRNIDVRRITYEPGYVVDYALKSLLKRTASNDEILVLNWGGTRLD